MEFEDKELLQDFLAEAQDLVAKLNEDLLALEKNPMDTDTINRVFRGFHTMKGSSGFLGLDAVSTLCHRAEDFLNEVRAGRMAVTPEAMDAWFASVDALEKMLAQVQEGVAPEAASDLIETFARLREGKPAPAKASPLEESRTPPPAEPKEEKKSESKAEKKEKPSSKKEEKAAGKEEKGEKTGEEGGGVSEEILRALLREIEEDKTLAAAEEAGQGEGKAPATEKAPGEAPAKEDKQGEERATEAKAQEEKALKTPSPAGKLEAPKPAAVPKTDVAETSVRVEVEVLDQALNLMGELVLIRNRLLTLVAGKKDEALDQAVATLSEVTSDLQRVIMRTRMQPIKKVFSRFPRLVRDLARSLKKDIELVVIGEETELDNSVVEALAAPLTHLVRNAVDHGIEPMEARQKAGKPKVGKITLAAMQLGEQIEVSVADDGGGIDPERIRKKAVEKGLLDEESAARLDRKAVLDLIFLPGFSIKDKATDVSGRGVGTDVVRATVSQLKGQVFVDSTVGKGTVFSMRLPLTLAVLPSLMVRTVGQVFAIPLAMVQEVIEFPEDTRHTVNGREVVLVRGEIVPLFFLRSAFPDLPPDEGVGPLVLVEAEGRSVAMVVDELLGQEEVVVKPLGVFVQGTPGIAGATITGEGEMALILDVVNLLRQASVKRRKARA